MLLDYVPNQERTFEAFLLRVARLLRADDWRVVFVFAGKPSPAFDAELKASGGDWRVAEFPLRSVRTLTEELRPFSPTVMVTTFQSCFNPRLLQLKRNLSIESWLVHDQSSGVASPKRGLLLALARLRGWYYGRHISSVMAVTEFVARRNVEQSFLPPDRIRVVPNGVDVERYRLNRQAHDHADRHPIVAFAGQLIPEKGVLTFLKAVAQLKNGGSSPPVTVRIAGTGPMEAELRQFAVDHLEDVEFLGQVKDTPSFFQEATIVVVPSEWAEAAGLVAMEAMACGACVLSSDRGGLPEVIGRNGEGGRLFRAGDVDDLAEKLRELIADGSLRQRLRTGGRARVEKLFSLDQMVSNFVREFTAHAASPAAARGGRSRR